MKSERLEQVEARVRKLKHERDRSASASYRNSKEVEEIFALFLEVLEDIKPKPEPKPEPKPKAKAEVKEEKKVKVVDKTEAKPSILKRKKK